MSFFDKELTRLLDLWDNKKLSWKEGYPLSGNQEKEYQRIKQFYYDRIISEEQYEILRDAIYENISDYLAFGYKKQRYKNYLNYMPIVKKVITSYYFSNGFVNALPENIKEDIEIALMLVNINSINNHIDSGAFYFSSFSENLRSNERVARAAIANNTLAYFWVCGELKKSKDLLLFTIKCSKQNNNKSFSDYYDPKGIDPSFYEDLEIVRELASIDMFIMRYCKPEFLNDRIVAENIVKHYAKSILELDPFIKDKSLRIKLWNLALKSDGSLFDKVPEDIQSNPIIMLAVRRAKIQSMPKREIIDIDENTINEYLNSDFSKLVISAIKQWNEPYLAEVEFRRPDIDKKYLVLTWVYLQLEGNQDYRDLLNQFFDWNFLNKYTICGIPLTKYDKFCTSLRFYIFEDISSITVEEQEVMSKVCNLIQFGTTINKEMQKNVNKGLKQTLFDLFSISDGDYCKIFIDNPYVGRIMRSRYSDEFTFSLFFPNSEETRRLLIEELKENSGVDITKYPKSISQEELTKQKYIIINGTSITVCCGNERKTYSLSSIDTNSLFSVDSLCALLYNNTLFDILIMSDNLDMFEKRIKDKLSQVKTSTN